MKFVALLRGINVGGNNKVDMKQLTAAMQKAGFKEVSTYINSGNIFFISDDDPKDLVTSLEHIIQAEFNLAINVLLRSAVNIDKVELAVPKEWTNDKLMKCDVMFLWDEFASKKVLELLTINTVDTVKYVDGAIVWKVDRQDLTKSGMNKLLGTKLYKGMTIRNCNTVRKLQERMS